MEWRVQTTPVFEYTDFKIHKSYIHWQKRSGHFLEILALELVAVTPWTLGFSFWKRTKLDRYRKRSINWSWLPWKTACCRDGKTLTILIAFLFSGQTAKQSFPAPIMPRWNHMTELAYVGVSGECPFNPSAKHYIFWWTSHFFFSKNFDWHWRTSRILGSYTMKESRSKSLLRRRIPSRDS